MMRRKSQITREGVSLLGISDAAESIGMRTIAVLDCFETLEKEDVTPFIAHWRQEHFVVVYKITKSKVYVADPAEGKITYTKDEFLRNWISTEKDGEKRGIALLLEPTPDFYEHKDEKADKNKVSFFAKVFTTTQKAFSTTRFRLSCRQFASAYISIFNPKYCRLWYCQ